MAWSKRDSLDRLLNANPKTRQPAGRAEESGVIVPAAKQGRIAYLPADLDRRYARDNLPDHGDLLANLVRWAAGEALAGDERLAIRLLVREGAHAAGRPSR